MSLIKLNETSWILMKHFEMQTKENKDWSIIPKREKKNSFLHRWDLDKGPIYSNGHLEENQLLTKI